MPSVTPSDGGYRHYARSISDLEDEKDQEVKDIKAKAEKREAKLEESYKGNLEDYQRELDETVRRVKEQASEDVQRDRDYSKTELDRARSQIYDRNGRVNRAEVDTLREQLRSTNDAAEEQARRHKDTLEKTEKAYSNRLSSFQEESARKAENAVARERDSAIETYERTGRASGSELDEYKRDLKSRAELGEAARAADVKFTREEAARSVEDAREELKWRLKHADENNDERLRKQAHQSNENLKETISDFTRSRSEENAMLRNQVNQALALKDEYAHGRAQGQAESVRKFENEWRAQQANDRVAAEQEMGDLRRQAREADKYFGFIQDKALREKDREFAKNYMAQNSTHQDELKNLHEKFDYDRAETAKANEADRSKLLMAQERRLNAQAERHAEAMEKSSVDQARALRDQKASDSARIDHLEDDLQRRLTSDDVGSVSPVAEKAIRDVYTAEFQRTLDAERDRNRDAFEQMHQRQNSMRYDADREATQREGKIRRENETQRQAERDAFHLHVKDVEMMSQDAKVKQEEQTRRNTELLIRNYTQSLDSQRREAEEVLQATKNDFEHRMGEQRAEADFQFRMAQRASAARQNELIREYEKKLADQKTELTARTEEVKAKSDQALRDQERKHRQEIDSLERAYSQRISVVETQAKERERTQTKNYEEELDKVRRANALLIQKKS